MILGPYYILTPYYEIRVETDFLAWKNWMDDHIEFRKIKEDRIPSRNVAIITVFTGVQPLFTTTKYDFKNGKIGGAIVQLYANSLYEANYHYEMLALEEVNK